MKLTWEKINKTVFLTAIVLLLFRSGNFYNSFIPKPYEVLFVVVLLLTIFYILLRNKTKSFFLSLPKKVWIAIFLLVISILIGWCVGLYAKQIPTTFNMILEFGTFSIGLLSLLLVAFYVKNDSRYHRWYLYALLVPVIYSVFVILHGLTPSFLLASDGNFTGFTTNVNIVSKILLIPTMFFITYALFESKNKKLKLGYIVLAILLTALLFWISSRGALLSLFFGAVFIWIVLSVQDFQWKTAISRAGIIILILILGFTLAPSIRQRVAINRLLNSDSHQTSYVVLQHQSLFSIVKNSIHTPIHTPPATIASSVSTPNEPAVPSETRLEIWPYYLHIILRNPFGFGPDTHMQSHFINKNGETLSSGPHNTYLEIWLWGGILGIVNFLYIISYAFNRLRLSLLQKYDFIPLALITILFSLCIAIMFDDSLSLYCFWIVLGLALSI